MNRTQLLKQQLQERILIIDGAMGSLIQTYGLDEAGYRGERFADHAYDVKNNNELLNLVRPDIIKAIHQAYLEAGAIHRDRGTRSQGSAAIQIDPRAGCEVSKSRLMASQNKNRWTDPSTCCL